VIEGEIGFEGDVGWKGHLRVLNCVIYSRADEEALL
jgi:hypothetical protein